MRLCAKTLLWRLLGLATLVGGGLIAVASVVYFTDDHPPFLDEKLPLAHPSWWLWAVRVHVAATLLALPSCVLLAWPWLQRRAVRLHRGLGRVAIGLLLFAVVPSGAYLSLFARGGWPSTLGFLLSGAIVAVAAVRAVWTARRGDLVAHRRAARHVLWQLAVAVSSRTLLVAFDAAGVDPERAYLLALWLPVLAGVLIVELTSPRPRVKSARSPRRTHASLDVVGLSRPAVDLELGPSAPTA